MDLLAAPDTAGLRLRLARLCLSHCHLVL